MSFFVKATAAPVPKTKNTQMIGIFLAVILVIMVTAQLFSFEDFPQVIMTFMLPYGDSFAMLRAALIVILEVAALPFLLMMYLSPAARIISMTAGWLTIVAWTFTSVWINLATGGVQNGGIFGATIPFHSGWWMVFFFVGLGALMAWASWGMWPLPPTEKK